MTAMDVIGRGWRALVWATIVLQFLLVIAAPYLMMLYLDRDPPLILYDGQITPYIRYNEETKEREVWRKVMWRAHRRKAPWLNTLLYAKDDPERWDCGGLTLRQIVHKRTHQLLPIATRERKGVFHPDPDDKYDGTVTTPDFLIGYLLPQGDATYQVTQFYYCNWLQILLDKPIVQPSPVLVFSITDREIAP